MIGVLRRNSTTLFSTCHHSYPFHNRHFLLCIRPLPTNSFLFLLFPAPVLLQSASIPSIFHPHTTFFIVSFLQSLAVRLILSHGSCALTLCYTPLYPTSSRQLRPFSPRNPYIFIVSRCLAYSSPNNQCNLPREDWLSDTLSSCCHHRLDCVSDVELFLPMERHFQNR